jgi:hypothetical protein
LTIPPLVHFKEKVIWRVIPTRFPPVSLFRNVAPEEDWDLIQEFEGRTNQRLTEEAFSRGLVRPSDRTTSSSSHYILGPITHPNPEGSQYSDGSFGILYAGLSFETAIAEVKAQREFFMRQTYQNKPQRLDMRVIVINLSGALHDLRKWEGICKNDIKQTRELSRVLREQDSYGIIFESEHHPQGECVGIFRPNILSNARQERHFSFIWDGSSITDTFELSQSA